jgi:nucleoside-diphosphate-sugar epimerase
MKLLVTGAGGFLGAALVERLLFHGYRDIRCNLRRQAGMAKLDILQTRYPQARLEYCLANLKYRDEVARATEGVQLIFHLAAGLKGDPADLFMDSVVASRNLLDAAMHLPSPRLVLVSSMGVYGTAELRRGAKLNEEATVEPYPERRDAYSQAKVHQERLFWEYQRLHGFELVVLRPGVVYGPGGSHFSDRVGLRIGRWQLHLGGNNVLPLTYVTNCAEAVVVAGTHRQSAGQIYNVHDDDLPTCRQYLRAYRREVQNIPSLSVPYFATHFLSRILAKYHAYSRGQLPAVLTPYKVASQWGGNRFDNSKLRSLGWKPLVSTAKGLEQSFLAFREELKTTAPLGQVGRAAQSGNQRPPSSHGVRGNEDACWRPAHQPNACDRVG